jgi:hypothetical protein
MAEAYGGWVATDDWRCGVNAWVLSTTDTTATVRVVCIFDNVYCPSSRAANGNVIRTSCEGNNNDSNFDLGYNYGHGRYAQIKTTDFTVARTSSDRNISAGAAIYVGSSTYRAWSSASVTLTIPHRQWYVPNPPKDAKLARVSDTSQKVTWASQDTGRSGARPWDGVYVDRSVDGSGYTLIKDVGASTVNYTDSSTSAGHKYEYRLRAHGPGGISDHVLNAAVYTTPTAFTGIRCSKPTTTTVQLTPTTSPMYYDSVVCQGSTDNGLTWADCAIDSDTLVIGDPPKGQVKFRLAAVKASGGTTSTDLQGAWCESDTIATLCDPNAPLVGDLPVVVATGSTVSVTWTPNHPDGTAQTKAQVKVTAPDGTATTADISGTTTATSFAATATGPYYVTIRTHGEYDGGDTGSEGWGAWSTPAIVRSAVAPSLSLTTPAAGATISSLPFAVAWDVSDATGIVSQTVSVRSKAKSAYSVDVTSGTTKASIATEAGLENEQAYTVAVTITAGSGLTATASADVTTEWTQSDNPTVDIAYDEAYAATITVTSAETGVPSVSYDLYRVVDGERLTLALGLEPGEAVIDRLPPLNVACGYEVNAYAESGAVCTTTTYSTCECAGMCVNWGTAARDCDVLMYDPDESRSADHDYEALHLFDGSALPVPYRTGKLDVSRDYSATMALADYDLLWAHALEDFTGYVREHDGQRAYGVIAVSLSRKLAGWAKATVKLTECAWEEPTNG